MSNILEVKNLSKHMGEGGVIDISFSVPYGSIVGLIGENGAGKTTIINTILGLMHKEEGKINIFGIANEKLNKKMMEKIGVVFDSNSFPVSFTPTKINNVLKKTYDSWDENIFYTYLKRFSIPENKKIKNFSQGMKVKLNLATALSHNVNLLILDEATNGLDPIVRNEILDIFLEFVQEETHSILVVSHLIADFDKIADYITFIHEGKIVFNENKDSLKSEYCIVKCGVSNIEEIDKKDIIKFIKKDYEYQFLSKDKTAMESKYKDFVVENVDVEEIMLFYIKGNDIE